MVLLPALAFIHRLIKQSIQPGDIVIDATVGNGHDTCFLAECVGPAGKVYGFDIQSLALNRAAARLEQQNLSERVQLFLDGHEKMRQHIPVEHHGAIRAVMFNLGYLPGSDKSVTTQADTTIAALEEALRILMPGGLISIVIYSGHAAGKIEQSALYHWASQLDQQTLQVAIYQFLNQKGNPPSLMALEKQIP
mgnify:CR=1 FL=1